MTWRQSVKLGLMHARVSVPYLNVGAGCRVLAYCGADSRRCKEAYVPVVAGELPVKGRRVNPNPATHLIAALL